MIHRVYDDTRVPVKLWLPYLEGGAEQQARNVGNHPFAFHHIAMMPDAHQGFGVPIGSVVALEGAVSPNMVGVDISCGVIACPTPLDGVEEDTLKAILGDIRATIPVGFKHNENSSPKWMPKIPYGLSKADLPVVEREWVSAERQVGSLGGGIEGCLPLQ